MKRRVRRVVAQGILAAIGLIVFLIGICFLLAATHIWLSGLLNPIASAAIIGGVLVLIAIILFLLAAVPGRGGPPKRPPVDPLGEAARESAERLRAAVGSGDTPLKNPALGVAGLALIIGFLLGRRGGGDND